MTFFSSLFRRVKCNSARIFLLCQCWQIEMEKIWNKSGSWREELWVVRLKLHLENNKQPPPQLFVFLSSLLSLSFGVVPLDGWCKISFLLCNPALNQNDEKQNHCLIRINFWDWTFLYRFPQSEFCQYPGSTVSVSATPASPLCLAW